MQPEQSQHGTLKNIMQPKKLRKRLHRVKGQHIFMLNQMTMAYLIQNSFLPCSDVRWICSILTSGRSENKQNRNIIECVLLTIKFYFPWKYGVLSWKGLTLDHNFHHLLWGPSMANVCSTFLNSQKDMIKVSIFSTWCALIVITV